MKRYDYCGWGRLALRGPDRVRFLHGMVTCNVEKLATGAGSRAAMLSVKGRLLATLVVYAQADELVLSLEPGLSEKVRVLLDKHVVMDDVEIVDLGDREELGFYGDDAASFIEGKLGVSGLASLPAYHQRTAGEVIVARDPSLGLVGFRVIGSSSALAALHEGDVMLDEEREALRIEHGTASYGVDLDEDRLVVEANLDDAISFDKGCYLGQEVVVRATSRGRVNRKLMGLVLGGEGIGRGKLTADAHADAGVLTSSIVSHDLGPIALGYVHRAALDADAPVRLEDGRVAMPVPLPFDVGAVNVARARLKP